MNEFIDIFGILIPYIVFKFFVFSAVFFLCSVVFYYFYPLISYYFSRSDNDDYLNIVSKNTYIASPAETVQQKSRPKYIKPNPESLYSLCFCPMTINEKNFYMSLLSVTGDKYYVYPQVKLDKLVFLPDTRKTKNPIKKNNLIICRNRISQKSVDFAIFDKSDLWPLCAIELDDKSHNLEDRIQRDDFVNSIFNDIGLKLYHFKAIRNSDTYDVNIIKSKLSEALPDL